VDCVCSWTGGRCKTELSPSTQDLRRHVSEHLGGDSAQKLCRTAAQVTRTCPVGLYLGSSIRLRVAGWAVLCCNLSECIYSSYRTSFALPCSHVSSRYSRLRIRTSIDTYSLPTPQDHEVTQHRNAQAGVVRS
jgi:hypothetical protein